MKKKTKIIIGVVAVLFVISGIQSIINPTKDNNSTLVAESTLSVATTEAQITLTSEATIPATETSESQTETEEEKPFTEKYATEIVVNCSMVLERFITDYKIPLAPQLWTIAKFDEEGAIMASADITEKSTKISQKAFVVLTPIMENDEMIGATPHYVCVGNTVYGDDGYCDEFFSNLESFFNTQ